MDAAQNEEAEVNIISGEDMKQLDQYQEVWKKYAKSGDSKVALFWHSGTFFNFFGLEDENGVPCNNFRDIVKILDLKITANRPKEKQSNGNPLKAGVPVATKDRWMHRMLAEGYIVVVVLQAPDDKTKREVAYVLTPGTQVLQLDSPLSNFIVGLYVENNTPRKDVVRVDRMSISIGMCAIDVSTGRVITHEASSLVEYDAAALDEAYRFLKATSAVELVICARGFKRLSAQQIADFQSYVKQHLVLESYVVRKFTIDDESDPPFMKSEYQSEVCAKFYPQGNCGLDMYQLSCAGLGVCANAIYEFRPSALVGILRPEVWSSVRQLVLNHNTAEQLDILHKGRRRKTDCLFRFLDNTYTPFGSRLLQTWLLNPLVDCAEICKRLDSVEMLGQLSGDQQQTLKNHLQLLTIDLKRLVRRAEMPSPHQELGVDNLYYMYYGFGKVREIHLWLQHALPRLPWFLTTSVMAKLDEFLSLMEQTFDLQVLEIVPQIPTNPKDWEKQRIFRLGANSEVDRVISEVGNPEERLNRICTQITLLLYPEYATAWKIIKKTGKKTAPVKIVKDASSVYFRLTKDDTKLLLRYRDEIRLQRQSDFESLPRVVQVKNKRKLKQADKTSVRSLEDESNSDEDDDDDDDDSGTRGSSRQKRNNQFQSILKAGAAPASNKQGCAAVSASTYLTAQQISLIESMSISETKTFAKVSFEETNTSYENMQSASVDIHRVVVDAFNEFVTNAMAKFRVHLDAVVNFAATLDVLFSHARTAATCNYHKPIIIDDNNKSASFEARDLRHPIAEKLVQSHIEYVPNDVTIGYQDGSGSILNGLMLFGINNSGKCLGAHTEVLCADGTKKKAKDIQLYDMLVGDDGTMRIVLSTTKGNGPMFKVSPNRNQKNEERVFEENGFTCNDEHLLVFEASTKISMPSDRKRVQVVPNEATGFSNKSVSFEWDRASKFQSERIDSEQDALDKARTHALKLRTTAGEYPQTTMSAQKVFLHHLDAEQKQTVTDGGLDALIEAGIAKVAVRKSWAAIRRPVKHFPAEFDLQALVNECFIRAKATVAKGVPFLSAEQVAYYIGLWLGDGAIIDVCQCEKLYPEVAVSLLDISKACGLKLVRYLPGSQSENGQSETRIVTDTKEIDKYPTCQYTITTDKSRNNFSANVLCLIFEQLGMIEKPNVSIGKKIIPPRLLATSSKVRYALLAGLLDTYVDNNHDYEIIQCRHELSLQILDLARSLGLQANGLIKTGVKGYEDRIHLSGSQLWKIPCQIRKKIASHKMGQRKRDELHYCVTMEYVGANDYYGFQLALVSTGHNALEVCDQLKEGTVTTAEAISKQILVPSNASGAPHTDGRFPGRFLLGDFTVTHNTLCLKSVATSVIMAQSGCFVPASSLRLRPFHNIITRLSGKDNMHGGQGTFAVEMSELRTILSLATPKTLVLGDEICHGTEYPSAISIVAASIEEMTRLNTNFLFATHLHALGSLPQITSLPTVLFKHFGVETRVRGDAEVEIIYNRKLQDGPGPSTYGIEVAAAQGIPPHVIKECHRIRRDMLGESTTIVDTRTSRYNAATIMDRCCMPGCEERAVETHHINEQCTADEHGVIDERFHKNSGFNLVPLCKPHHADVTYGRTLVIGWAMMLSGRRTLIVEQPAAAPVPKRTKPLPQPPLKPLPQSQSESSTKLIHQSEPTKRSSVRGQPTITFIKAPKK